MSSQSDLDDALRLIGTKPELGTWAGGVREPAIIGAEQRLDLHFPPTFRTFLRLLGGGGYWGDVVAGLSEDGKGDDIRFLTELERATGDFPPDLLVIGPDGTGGLYAIRCGISGSEGPVLWASPSIKPDQRALHPVAEHFGGFLRALVEEAIEAQDPSPDAPEDM